MQPQFETLSHLALLDATGSHRHDQASLPLLMHRRRYVRQDSPLWRALHAGVLTSSTLSGALGFYEPAGVAQLGLPRHMQSRGPLLAAYQNLRAPPHAPPAPPVSLAEAFRRNE